MNPLRMSSLFRLIVHRKTTAAIICCFPNMTVYITTEADPGSVQGVRTPALLIRVLFWKKTGVHNYHRECITTHHFDIRNTKIFWGGGYAPSPDPTPLGAFGARPPVPLLDGLDTRPCKILDPPLNNRLYALLRFAISCVTQAYSHYILIRNITKLKPINSLL